MPIYRYKCEDCGEIFTLLRDLNDTSEVRCAKCGGRAKKLISNVGIKFNAPGFYSTTVSKKASDSKKEESPKKEKSETKKDAKTKGK